MPRSKRLPCDDPEWTRRKTAIEMMYVVDRLSQEKIRGKLKEDGFLVTKSELEAQLRFWKIRKNASANVWRYTDHMLLKREQQGKASVVYYNRNKISCNTLKKERGRYQLDTLTKYTTALSPKTPEGLELCIRTPTPGPVQSMSASDFAVNVASMMPEKAYNEITSSAQLILQGPTDQAFNEHVQLVLYCLSNDMYEIDCDDTTSWVAVVNLIERSGLTNQPLDLAQEKDLTVTSITENLFRLCLDYRRTQEASASSASNSSVLSWLLESGQDPNGQVIIASEACRPLQVATGTCDFKLAMKLLDAGANPNLHCTDNYPPLFELLRDDLGLYLNMIPEQRDIFKDLVLRLLKAGASLNEGPYCRGPSALMWAVRLDLQIAKILIQHGSKVEYQERLEQDMRIDITGHEFIRTQSVVGFAMYDSNEKKAMRKIRYLVGHLQRYHPVISVGDLLAADVVCLAGYFGFNKVINYWCSYQNDSNTRQHGLFTALCAASFNGHRNTCELLLQCGAPIKSPEWLQAIPSPLHFAALTDRKPVIELLCENGADVNAEFEASDGFDHERNYMWNRAMIDLGLGGDKRSLLNKHSLHVNPLGAAIIGADEQTPQSLETLIQYGAKMPTWALYYGASVPQHPGIVHSAVKQGGNLGWRGPDGRTPLQRVLQSFTKTELAMRTSRNGRSDKHDCLEVINSLVDAGAETAGNEAELTVLLEHWSHPDEVSLLASQKVFRRKTCSLSVLAAIFLTRSIPRIERALASCIGAYDPGALCAGVMLAISSGSTVSLEQLIANRPEAFHGHEQEGIALGLAAWHSRIDILDMLLPKIQSSTPAFVPASKYYNRLPDKKDIESKISESFERGIPFWHREPKSQSEFLRGSPLIFSIWSQECLEKLLENNFNPDRLTISIAVCHGEIELLERLAPRMWDDDRGLEIPGPLYWSLERRQGKITEVLLKAGLSPNESNFFVEFGRSPFQKAVEDGNLEMIDLLLECGADVNAPAAQHGGATALQLAAIKGRLGIAKRLVDLGANINAPGADKNGRTALEGAAEYGRLDMVHLLLDCGANVAGDGCLQYLKAIRFAEEGAHMVVADFLENHREWTRFDHEMWGLLIELDKKRLEELGSLEELIDSSTNSEETDSPSSSDKDGDIPEEVVHLDDDSDYGHDSSGEGSSAEGRIRPTEATPGDESLGQLEESSEAVPALAGTDYNIMIVEDHIASHIYDDTAWNQQLARAENEVQISWDFGPIEAVHGVHTMQGFQSTDFNIQPELNQQLATANQDLQAAWETLPMEGVDYEVMMEDQLFLNMIVDSAWNQHFGTTDWSGPQSRLGTEMESGVCYEIFEGDMDWVETQDHDNQ
ncbi:NF-kappa-B inhibitor alpha [Colletotrichum tropicale]|nr:NF-kappa-B inhibitor alpha [Colletotrichum tropicale]